MFQHVFFTWYSREHELDASIKTIFFHNTLGGEGNINTFVVGDGDFSFTVSLLSQIMSAQNKNGKNKITFVTSVLQQTKQELVDMYNPNNSKVLENIRIMKQHKIPYYFGVDATKLEETAAAFSSLRRRATTTTTNGQIIQFHRIVFCYPFPTTNGSFEERTLLISRFFQSVKEWSGFDKTNGHVVLGLKSTVDQEDYQYDYWKVQEIAMSAGFQRTTTITTGACSSSSQASFIPFWRATHVNGRPLDKVKHIFDDCKVRVKFYSFEMNNNKEEG